jgi:hypothetical protein
VQFSLFVQSSHGAKWPMPMVEAVDVEFKVGWQVGNWWLKQDAARRCAEAAVFQQV